MTSALPVQPPVQWSWVAALALGTLDYYEGQFALLGEIDAPRAGDLGARARELGRKCGNIDLEMQGLDLVADLDPLDRLRGVRLGQAVRPDADVRITFDRPMSAWTLSPNTIYVEGSSRGEIVRRAPAKEVEQAYNSGTYEFAGEQLPFYWSGALLQASQRSNEPQAKTLPVVIFRGYAKTWMRGGLGLLALPILIGIGGVTGHLPGIESRAVGLLAATPLI